MSVYLRALPDIARVSFARLIAYRAEMAIWILTAMLPLVMLALWNTVVADEAVAGFGPQAVGRYFVAALVVRQLTGAWLVWQLNGEIRTGALSAQLLRPVHPLFVDAVWMFTALPLRLVILSPVVAAVLLWRPDLLALPSPTALLLFIPSVLMAWALEFMVQGIFGMLAFWLDRSEGLYGIWLGLWLVLSGYIAPLAVFPEWAQAALAWLPFRSMLAVPVELLGGFLTPQQAMVDLARQGMWVAIFALLTAAMWRRGLARYGAFGA